MKLEEIQSTGKGVRYIHVDPTPATRFMKGKSNGQNFSQKLTHGKKISTLAHYKLYFSLKHICRMYYIKHNPTL